jgi:hypothetical protein
MGSQGPTRQSEVYFQVQIGLLGVGTSKHTAAMNTPTGSDSKHDGLLILAV